MSYVDDGNDGQVAETIKMTVLGALVRYVVTLSLRLTLLKSPFPTLTIETYRIGDRLWVVDGTVDENAQTTISRRTSPGG
ncbi:unnamed protein product [Penicillium pancosmium]